MKKSLLGFSQIELCPIGRENVTLQWIAENLMFDSASRLVIFFDSRWVMVLYIYRSWKYLVAEATVFPETEKHMIQMKKMTVTMIWNPLDFHMIDIFSKASLFNARYSIEYILQLNRLLFHFRYRLVDKYMRQHPVLSSGVRISRKFISRVWTIRKIK
jgi:hypothetical protein